MNKFKPLKTRFRATFGAGELASSLPHIERVDVEHETLTGVQITLEGEAKGHGVHLDREFCEAVAAQGNATGDVGLKVRYGHPSMCSDAIGTELARAKNFRVVDVERTVDGQQVKCAGVLADVYILKSAHAAPQGDIAKHVLAVAAEDPSQFGQSIVFTFADLVVKDKDGNRHSYKAECCDEDESKNKTDEQWEAQSADGKIYVVLGKLLGSDFTDTPAATDGIFSTGTLAEEAEQMLDEHPQILELLEKHPKSVMEFLARTGLDKKLESARVAGLQAAKDKEIATLKTEIAELSTAKETAASDLGKSREALDAANATVKQLTADAEKTAKELSDTKAAFDKATKELSDTKAALEKAESRYREQVGTALKPNGALAGLSGRALALAALSARNG
ncbi:MAG: hypothetical protein IJ173_00835 [Kiritimatiellae bacterium]|nr:hypothetical protein [Kiritimatiellia bacterium]